jgi:simple sugar transport system permease protein
MERLMAIARDLSALRKRKQSYVRLMFALSAFSFVVFAYLPKVRDKVTFGFVLGDEWVLIEKWVLDPKTGSYGFSFAALAFAVLAYIRLRRDKKFTVAGAGFSVSLFMAFLCWAAAGDFIPFTGLLQGGLFLAIPLVFGALGGLICERSGVINIAIEGQLLAGAFAAGVTASLSQNLWIGLAIAPVAGALISLLLAVFAIRYAIDQVILGFVLNVLVIGLTSFASQRVLTTNSETWNTPPIFKAIAIPVLSKLPLIGPILFNQTLIVYMLYVIVAIVQISLFKSKWGLRMRSVGEHPTAAESVGIDVNRVRFWNVILAGAVAGLGGAFFTIGSAGAFSRQMTAGLGFIALAALIFGRWTPLGALSAALVFGFADQLRSVLSISGTPIPSEFMLMVPYIATIIAVSGVVGRVRAPAADGIPYSRGNK